MSQVKAGHETGSRLGCAHMARASGNFVVYTPAYILLSLAFDLDDLGVLTS